MCDFQSAICTGNKHDPELAPNRRGKSRKAHNYEYHYSHIFKLFDWQLDEVCWKTNGWNMH
jgi:hypothetical protein